MRQKTPKTNPKRTRFWYERAEKKANGAKKGATKLNKARVAGREEV
jgi:hypothetical protein